jgi:NFU1 iron-sulfur cluster scaffold homolog, mitochondrial
MPKIAEIEHTPNPNAVKFLLKEPVAMGLPKSFPDAVIAQADPLATALFAVGHVVSVFMQDKVLTVTKDEDIGWTELLPKLAPPIRSAPAISGEAPAASTGPRFAISASGEATPIEDDPLLQQVAKVLAETILPALAADGGGLEIIGRHDKQVMIRYQGACSTCPASMTGTLMALEGILQKDVDPEIVVITV